MKPGLSKQAIVEAALGVLDDLGIEGLTVRAVAARLNVQAPALYWHVRDKQELRDEMATEMWRRIGAELDALPLELTWQQKMVEFAVITRRTLLAIRDGAKVFTGTYLTDPGVLKSQESNLALMLDEGFTLVQVYDAFSLVYGFTVGFCVEEQAVAQSLDRGENRYSLETRRERVDDGEHPLVTEGGPLLFGEQTERFLRLVGVLVEAADRMRGETP